MTWVCWMKFFGTPPPIYDAGLLCLFDHARDLIGIGETVDVNVNRAGVP